MFVKVSKSLKLLNNMTILRQGATPPECNIYVLIIQDIK